MSKRKSYPALQSLATYMSRYKLHVAVVFICFVIANVCTAVFPLFIGRLVGALAAHPANTHSALLYMWALIAASFFHTIFWHGSELLYRKFLNPKVIAYENILFTRVINSPYPFFVDKFTGKLSSYITTISRESRDFIERLFWSYTYEVVSLIAILIILTSINWQTAVIMIVGLLLMIISGRVTLGTNIAYEKTWTDVDSTKNGKIIDAVANFINVKSFHKEQIEIATIKREQQKNIAASNRSLLWSIVFWATMGTIVRDLIWPATIAFNVYLFLHHEINITQLATLLSVILLFVSFIWDLIGNISQFGLRMARMEEAYVYLFDHQNIAALAQDSAPDAVVAMPDFEHTIHLDHIHFQYPDNKKISVLEDIDLAIKKGEKIGVVGKSGSGKTTLTKLMLGYYPVDTGMIKLDNKPIDIRHFSKLISYVPQDTSLFHRTIAENIAYATDKDVTRKEIVKAARQAHAHDFIGQIKDGYEALVGERGVKLSAGQRQRIAIARAFLDDKPILILDEATSALDSESEILVQEALEALWEHKTVIAIAHRLSTLRHMDRIIVMDAGRIVEQGSHAELLKLGGHYAKLWTHQSGGFIEE